MENLTWRKSSHSGNGGDTCVEMARTPHSVAVRDSEDPDGPRHSYALPAIKSLFADIRHGRYDLI
ncbi:hypothetical protein GCM10022254_40440 [Actinomadura meridiana]|uniref:DUF397 domain-containing protein n=2 Tax=Actinomadura meridiana TaxID=559626 RepID=A0ABP8C6T0_9ACTN